MRSELAAPVTIQTSPEEVPSIPPWFAEVVLLARWFEQQGYLSAISEQVRLARGRAGTYEVLDFVVVLLGYAVSGEPTLEAFFERLLPFARPFMALFGRDQLPARSTLSRFLEATDLPCLEALRRLFLQDRLLHGFLSDQMGGFYDAQGQRVLIFDLDGTRQAARQRALATTPDLPPLRRRLSEVCAPGYTGRKRGEVVRTRTTVLQAHTQEWLGSFSNPGSGDYSAELLAACQAITAYLTARQLDPADALLRLDGLYGSLSLLLRLHPLGLGFLVRGRDYRLLEHHCVKARLLQAAELSVTHPETGIQRDLFDVGFITDYQPERPQAAISYRVLLTRRVAPADPKDVSVGKLRDGWVYELFLTSRAAHSLPAATVLELYQHRGSFEQVLSDEDAEQDPDRWCSHSACGQEFWQLLSQWVWNSRLTLGSVSAGQEVRWTAWASETAAPGQEPASAEETPAPAQGEDRLAEVTPATIVTSRPSGAEELEVPSYGPLRLAYSWRKEQQPFAAPTFQVGEQDTLVCPEGKVLRVNERRVQANTQLRVVYAAKVSDCRSCRVAQACLGESGALKRGRRVSGTRQVVGGHQPKAAAREQVGRQEGTAEPRGQKAHSLHWADIGGRRVRRELVKTLRRQQVSLISQEPQAESAVAKASACTSSRAERAHRRRSWASRLARNACSTTSSRWSVTLPGVPPALAAYLGLPSASAS
jgi:hypothetical protein